MKVFGFIQKVWRSVRTICLLNHSRCISQTDPNCLTLFEKSDDLVYTVSGCTMSVVFILLIQSLLFYCKNQTAIKPLSNHFMCIPLTDRKFPALFENLEYINVTNMWYGYQICQMHFLNCCKVFTLIQKLRQWKYLIHMVCLPDYVRCMSPTVSKSSTYMKT